jgi:hypothetical protein
VNRWSWLLCPSLLSCGASTETAPVTAADAPREAVAVDGPEEIAEAPAEAPAVIDACADGSCQHCGEAVCLSGFYCDEGAGACAWVPACAKDPTCECLQQALPGCQCEVREGGLFVRCN